MTGKIKVLVGYFSVCCNTTTVSHPVLLALPYATYNISFVVVSRKELSIPLLGTR